MFAAWGTAAHRYRIPVLAFVVITVLAGGGWGLGVFERLSAGGYETPGSEAVQARDVVEEKLGGQGDLVVIYRAPEGRTVDDPALGERISGSLNALPSGPVDGVTSYWQTPLPQLASEDRGLGLASIELAGSDISEKLDSYEQIKDRLRVDGVRTHLAGETALQHDIEEQAKSDLATAEMISMPVVLALLVIIFGGVVAASLPVLVGGLAVFGSLGLLRLISLFADVNVFAINVASLLGLGLAIDYGLFIVGRFREELAGGHSGSDAVRRSMASAGRTVAFSATLLVTALAALMLFPQDFIKSLAYGGTAAVGLAAVISLTALPALLAILGPKVDKLALPWRRKQPSSAGWRRLADRVMKRPLLTAVPILGLLAALGAPFLGVQFGTPDERMLPETAETRQAVETLRAEFPEMDQNGVQVVLQGRPNPVELRQFNTKIEALPGVNSVAPGGQQNGTTVLNAGVTGDTYGEQAKNTVEDIRAISPPGGTEVLVGGPTALNLDSLHATIEKLPLVAGVMVGATLLLMFLAFGSVLLPIKAVLLSALSLSATFGVLTWVFVDGYGAAALGVTPAPIGMGVVVLMASVVFGLSTDYEVFLMSRMVEARANGASTPEAVRAGLASTGRMITAAAMLLIVVTGAFAFSEIAMMRFIGVGMIFALALDATVVRILLVPAVLKLMGAANWWAPGPLKRLQQRAGVHEGEPEPGAVGGSAESRSGSDRSRETDELETVKLEIVESTVPLVDNFGNLPTQPLPASTDYAQVGITNRYPRPNRKPVDNSVDRSVEGLWTTCGCGCGTSLPSQVIGTARSRR